MEDNQIKVVLIGDSGVGKSSILDMFINNKFHPNLESTIGSSFKTKELTLGTRTLKLNIWDTAGQERYHSLTKMYCRGASVAILVYDITKIDTFTNLKKWHSIVLESGSTDVIFAVVGNKEDLIDREEVSLEEAREFTLKIGGFYKKTSARTNFGIDDLFQSAAYKMFPELNSRASSMRIDNITLVSAPEKKGCCF